MLSSMVETGIGPRENWTWPSSVSGFSLSSWSKTKPYIDKFQTALFIESIIFQGRRGLTVVKFCLAVILKLPLDVLSLYTWQIPSHSTLRFNLLRALIARLILLTSLTEWQDTQGTPFAENCASRTAGTGWAQISHLIAVKRWKHGVIVHAGSLVLLAQRP